MEGREVPDHPWTCFALLQPPCAAAAMHPAVPSSILCYPPLALEHCYDLMQDNEHRTPSRWRQCGELQLERLSARRAAAAAGRRSA